MWSFNISSTFTFPLRGSTSWLYFGISKLPASGALGHYHIKSDLPGPSTVTLDLTAEMVAY